MRARDIEALVAVGRPDVARDGSFTVFATSRPDLAADRAVGQIWRLDPVSGAHRRLTRGVSDSSPRIAPDDSAVAFLRADARGRTQLFVVAPEGGEPLQVTDAPLGVTGYAWAPDARSLAFIARMPEQGRYGTVDGLPSEAEPARRITGIRWHANGLGYIADRPAQLFVVAAPDLESEPTYPPAVTTSGDTPDRVVVPHEPRRLVSDDVSYASPVFTPDGADILAVCERIEEDRRDLRTPVVAIAVDGSSIREVVPMDAGLAVNEVAVAADGSIVLLAYTVGASGRDFVAPGVALWLLEADGPRALTDAETIDLGEVGSHLAIDGDGFLVQDRTRGRVRLLRVDRGGETRVVLDGDVEVLGHATAGGRVVAAVATPDSFGEVVVVSGTDRRTVTDFGSAVRERGVVLPRELEAVARDGYPLHGWVATPAGEGPFPVILQIHGGPYAAYGVHLFDETQVLVDAGYAVVYGNPRGSAGYGRTHGRSIRQAMGTVDMTDVLELLEAALHSDSRLDGDRLGIMGGSYGGYLTAWTIAHDHRFAAAIVERGFLDPVSMQGTSDIGTFFGDEYVGVDAEDIARQSPLAVVGGVRTPTLVIHSELDFRCPLEQSTRYYSALRRHGVPAEMLIFPGEDHELTRAGRPRHRVERFDAVVQWWNRHLPVA
ncbi:S9 family peptidase [Microbacterium chocolatum]|uniref:S9 family peptidase n=1 Tax=Microbacterium aurantiacum TaxID=162393 RepID=UPI00338F0CCC